MMRLLRIGAACLALAACDAGTSAAEQKAADDRDIGMVEAAQRQHPPPVAIDLEPITEADIAANRLYGGGCALIPANVAPPLPVLLLRGNRASLKIDSRMQSLAGDAGGPKLAMNSASRYSGKRFVMDIAKTSGDALNRWPATVTIRDPWGQIIYKRDGALECGA